MTHNPQSGAQRPADGYTEAKAKVYDSLLDHARTAGITDADLATTVDVLDRLAGWAVDELFPFPCDPFGNPMPGERLGSMTPEWRLWSSASGIKEDVSWTAEVLRTVHDRAQAKAVRA